MNLSTGLLYPPEVAAEEMDLELADITRYLRKGPLKFHPISKNLITGESMIALQAQLDREAKKLEYEEIDKRQKIEMARIERREKNQDMRYLRERIRQQILDELELTKDRKVRAETEKRVKAYLSPADIKQPAVELKRRAL